MSWLITRLGQQTTIADDDVWVVDSTPVECARSRETVHRSDLAGYAEYGYCASRPISHSITGLHRALSVRAIPGSRPSPG